MQLREFTQDFLTLRECVFDNEYQLPDEFGPGDVILDIGAHIGCFALACISRGAKKVVCYEADLENFVQLKKNMAPYRDVVEVRHAAVWRSDKAEQARIFRNESFNACHMVGNGVGGDLVPTIRFDTILHRLGQVTLLKLDCEGSEYPIVYTSDELGRVESIAAEVHDKLKFAGCPHECSIQGFVDYLNNNGFEARAAKGKNCDPDYNQYVFARRTDAQGD